jgi:drug/metabolite transporter (DMT)-like permease
LILAAVAIAFGDLALGGGTRGLLLVITLSMISTALPITLFLVGIRHIGAGRAAVLSTVEPLVTVILAALLLDERIGLVQYVGGALILTGILWLRSERPLPAREAPTPFDSP